MAVRDDRARGAAAPVDWTAARILDALRDARRRTLALVDDLGDAQLIGPRLPIVNPLLWEIGHVAWFQERWALRELRSAPPIRPDGDALYDSSAVPHETRWSLPLPSRAGTLGYMAQVFEAVAERLAGRDELAPREAYFHLLPLFHEDMHDEAFLCTRQTLGYPPPSLAAPHVPVPAPGSVVGDVDIPGGEFLLGAARELPFVFDNEKWAHPVRVDRFSIARAAVTQREFAGFVDDGGYERRELWSEEGWRWRQESAAACPVYWRRDAAGGWLRRRFDVWVPLEEDLPVVHVNAFEADAYCRGTGRRLPTEAEWELAAAAEPRGKAIAPTKRTYPWGSEPPSPAHAHLGARGGGCVPVGALVDGDSAFGCRQMIGNVWEWTASPFQPYPGFVADPYADYSQPWFGTQRVLRGGCWATQPRLIRNTWRNFYSPDRRDVWAGFRTCAAGPPP